MASPAGGLPEPVAVVIAMPAVASQTTRSESMNSPTSLGVKWMSASMLEPAGTVPAKSLEKALCECWIAETVNGFVPSLWITRTRLAV